MRLSRSGHARLCSPCIVATRAFCCADSLPLLQRARAQQGRAQSNAAAAALENMLSSQPGGQAPKLMEAIITKYVALSPEELEEWRVDPEG